MDAHDDSSTSPVRLERIGDVATITLDRPASSNALDLALALAFRAAVGEVRGSDARAVLVAGAGARFCAGGDLASMLRHDDRPAYLRELASVLTLGFRELSQLPVPVVASVQGAVAGAGMALLLSADLVVAARGTKMLMAYAGVGLTPDCGVSYLLPRAVGQQRALELALTGRVLSADEALDWGLVTMVVDDGAQHAEGLALATRLAGGPAYALGEAKRLVRSSFAVTREDSGEDEAETIARAVATPEAQALIDAFVSGQRPRPS